MRLSQLFAIDRSRGASNRALRESLRHHLRNRSVMEATPTQDYLKLTRDAERWARDMKTGLKSRWKHYAPDRPMTALRTGAGKSLIERALADDSYWDDPGARRKAKLFWDKWQGRPAQNAFNASARGLS